MAVMSRQRVTRPHSCVMQDTLQSLSVSGDAKTPTSSSDLCLSLPMEVSNLPPKSSSAPFDSATSAQDAASDQSIQVCLIQNTHTHQASTEERDLSRLSDLIMLLSNAGGRATSGISLPSRSWLAGRLASATTSSMGCPKAVVDSPHVSTMLCRPALNTWHCPLSGMQGPKSPSTAEATVKIPTSLCAMSAPSLLRALTNLQVTMLALATSAASARARLSNQPVQVHIIQPMARFWLTLELYTWNSLLMCCRLYLLIWVRPRTCRLPHCSTLMRHREIR